MTSPLPPRRRDTRHISDVVRQDRMNLRQLGVGFAGGRFPPARPLRPASVDMDDDEEFDDETAEIAFRNTDRTTATSAGSVTFRLIYEPIPGSLHIRWNGIDQPPTDWVLSGTVVTVSDSHIKVGDIFTAAYAYYPSDVPIPVILVPAEDSTTSDTTPTITGTGVGGQALEVFIDGVSVGTDTIAADGTWTVTVGSALASGAHTITATQTDSDGSTSDAEPVVFSVVSPTPATASLRGGTSAKGFNGPSLTNLALPTGTQVGDLIVLCPSANGGSVATVTDSRLTQVNTSGGGILWLGFATDLTDVQMTITGGAGFAWAVSCITLITNAVGWTADVSTVDSVMSNGQTLALGSVANVGAAVSGCRDSHTIVDGNTGLPTGWTTGIDSTNGKSHSRIDFWDNGGVLGTTPSPSTTTFAGGSGGARTTIVGLIGP